MNYYEEIKSELLNNEINKNVKNYLINKNDLSTYYNVGKMLSEAGKHYGEGIVKEYELKWSALPTKLSWSHITELMVLSDRNEIEYCRNSRITVREYEPP